MAQRLNPWEIQPGELRHRVEIQEDQADSADSHGQTVPDWLTVKTVWAKVEGLTGSEIFWAQQNSIVADLKVTIRYWSRLTAQHQFLFGEQVLGIVYVDDVLKRHQKMICFCKAAG